jgi:hypothetical protein
MQACHSQTVRESAFSLLGELFVGRCCCVGLQHGKGESFRHGSIRLDAEAYRHSLTRLGHYSSAHYLHSDAETEFSCQPIIPWQPVLRPRHIAKAMSSKCHFRLHSRFRTLRCLGHFCHNWSREGSSPRPDDLPQIGEGSPVDLLRLRPS